MTITLTLKEQDELHEEAERQSLQNVEKFETISQISRQLGKGCVREIEVYPNLWLSIDDWQYHDDVRCQVPVAEHPLHFNVLLSGKRKSDYGTFGEGYTLISGGGIQPQMTEETEKFQHILGVQILMPPSMLANFFFGEDGEILPQLKMLARDNDWQEILYLKTTPAIQGVLATSECRVIQHQLGETCIPLKPQRIIALEDAWIVDPLLALGIKPVGTVTFAKQVNVNFRGLSADELAGIEIVGNGGQPSLEKILRLKPDLILSFDDPFDSNNYKLLSQIAPTVPIDFNRVRLSFKDNLRFIAQLVGREEKAEKILAQYQDRIKELQKILVNNNLDKSKVSIIEYLGGNTFELQRSDIIYFQIFSDIGLDMPHRPLNPDDFVSFNIEVINKYDADILFIVSVNGNKEKLSSHFNGILSSLNAVKNKRAYIVDPYLWWVYGPLGVNKLLDELPKYLLESV